MRGPLRETYHPKSASLSASSASPTQQPQQHISKIPEKIKCVFFFPKTSDYLLFVLLHSHSISDLEIHRLNIIRIILCEIRFEPLRIIINRIISSKSTIRVLFLSDMIDCYRDSPLLFLDYLFYHVPTDTDVFFLKTNNVLCTIFAIAECLFSVVFVTR